MLVEKGLGFLRLVQNDSESSCREDDVIFVDVLEVVAGIETSEAMCVPQMQIAIRFLVTFGRVLPDGRLTLINLAFERKHS